MKVLEPYEQHAEAEHSFYRQSDNTAKTRFELPKPNEAKELPIRPS